MEKVDKAKQFVTEARGELKKVTWPSKQQTLNATWIVITMVVIIAVFLGLVDFLLSGVVKYLLR